MNYIWDFDGTLYDTYPMMIKALMKTFTEFSLPQEETKVYRKIKEDSIHQMIIDWQLPVPTFDETYHLYEARNMNQSLPFKETKEVLTGLKANGGQHFILTHRQIAATWKLLERDGLDSLITEVVGSDSAFPRKPDPAAINYFIEKYQLDREQTFMIGDRKLDIEAGNNAKTKTVFYDLDHFKQDINATYRINNLKEML
ncbi:HAD-IA family hydrolase [Enterococcus devriesei]|uniref:HAD-IA family hydrolase n=1 Tax=Enterococcus devriesei TaxID=319970 RepID=UPI0036D31160